MKCRDLWPFGAVVTRMRPGDDIVQAYRLRPDGMQETVIKNAAGQPLTAPGWFMSMDGFQTMIPGEEGMLYREEEPKPRAKTAAKGRRVRSRKTKRKRDSGPPGSLKTHPPLVPKGTPGISPAVPDRFCCSVGEDRLTARISNKETGHVASETESSMRGQCSRSNTALRPRVFIGSE